MASGRTLDGPQPNRPSSGRSSLGIWMSGSSLIDDSIASTTVSCTSIASCTDMERSSAMKRLSHRVDAVADSLTLAIDAKAKAMKAAGEPVVSFGAGEPDYPTPPAIVEAAAKACHDPRNHKYSPTPGLPELREAIAVKTKRDSGYEVTAAQVLVTNGGKQAVSHACAALLDEGDEVILPGP